MIDVGTDLSSRVASNQVLSARVSLTSVFGMGTGGPSPLKAPTYHLLTGQIDLWVRKNVF